MTRQSNAHDSSLELLLDTICNTFGGIVFISMLVVTLLNLSSERLDRDVPSSASQLELVRLETERQAVHDELTRLRRDAENQTNAIGALVSEDVIRAARELHRTEENVRRALARKSRLVGEGSQSQIAINEIQQRSEDRLREIEVKLKELDSLKRQYDKMVQARAKKAAVSTVRQSHLIPIVFFLKNHRLYGPLRVPGGAENTTDFARRQEGGATILDANPNGGAPITPEGPIGAEASRRLQEMPSASCSIKLFVWEDSFDECEVVRQEIRRLGLAVALVPMTAAKHVVFTSGSSSPNYVQP